MGDRPPLTYSPTHSNVLNCAAMGLSRVATDAGGFMPTAGTESETGAEKTGAEPPQQKAVPLWQRLPYQQTSTPPNPAVGAVSVLRTPRHGVHVLSRCSSVRATSSFPVRWGAGGRCHRSRHHRVHRLGGRPSDSRRARRHVRGWLRRARPSCVPGVRLAARRGDHAHHRPVLRHPTHGDHVIRDDGGAIPALPHWMGRLDDAAGVLAGVLRRGFPAGQHPEKLSTVLGRFMGRCCWRSSQCCS